MGAVWRAVAFLLIAVCTPLCRTAIAGFSGQPFALGLEAFDFALDADMGALGIIVGVGFYVSAGGVLINAAGEPITTADVRDCCAVLGAAGFVTLAFPLWFGLNGLRVHGDLKDIVTLWLPDGLSAFALAFTVIRLT